MDEFIEELEKEGYKSKEYYLNEYKQIKKLTKENKNNK